MERTRTSPGRRRQACAAFLLVLGYLGLASCGDDPSRPESAATPAGTVVDASGNPVESVSISLVYDLEGDGIPAGQLSARTRPPTTALQRRRIPLEPGMRPRVIALQPDRVRLELRAVPLQPQAVPAQVRVVPLQVVPSRLRAVPFQP